MTEFEWCELCGNDIDHGAIINIVWTVGGETTVRCRECEERLESGMVRVEYVDGVPRLRQWIFEWRPGDLLPSAADNRKKAGL